MQEEADVALPCAALPLIVLVWKLRWLATESRDLTGRSIPLNRIEVLGDKVEKVHQLLRHLRPYKSVDGWSMNWERLLEAQVLRRVPAVAHVLHSRCRM